MSADKVASFLFGFLLHTGWRGQHTDLPPVSCEHADSEYTALGFWSLSRRAYVLTILLGMGVYFVPPESICKSSPFSSNTVKALDGGSVKGR